MWGSQPQGRQALPLLFWATNIYGIQKGCKMALLGAVTRHRSPSEAAQICLWTDVHFQIQMQWWKMIAFHCSWLLFFLQVVRAAPLTAA